MPCNIISNHHLLVVVSCQVRLSTLASVDKESFSKFVRSSHKRRWGSLPFQPSFLVKHSNINNKTFSVLSLFFQLMESQNEFALIDLNDERNTINQPSAEPAGHHGFSLPQVDGGKEAWLFLAAGFIVEALVWG
jgi:hypothetical protein